MQSMDYWRRQGKGYEVDLESLDLSMEHHAQEKEGKKKEWSDSELKTIYLNQQKLEKKMTQWLVKAMQRGEFKEQYEIELCSNFCQTYMTDLIWLKYNITADQLESQVELRKLIQNDDDCKTSNRKTKAENDKL